MINSDKAHIMCTALKLAAKAHYGIMDKTNTIPYIEHPLTVMFKVKTFEEKVLAILHDVVEDSHYTIEDIRKMKYDNSHYNVIFPTNICDALDAITHRENETNIEYWIRVKANPLALSVKLMDIEHNSSNERMGNLPPGDQERMKTKYKKALEFLLS